jgi:hypothetical protein
VVCRFFHVLYGIDGHLIHNFFVDSLVASLLHFLIDHLGAALHDRAALFGTAGCRCRAATDSPANLESQNPALKAAAKVKSEEDLAPQKIKAIKYLATIGCGCYPGVREALLAALDDCTESVRYEAAIAFCQAAGNDVPHGKYAIDAKGTGLGRELAGSQELVLPAPVEPAVVELRLEW